MKTVWAKSLEKMWADDLRLLGRVRPRIKCDSDVKYHHAALLNQALNRWLIDSFRMDSARKPLEMSLLETVASEVRPKVEELMGARLEKLPTYEIVDVQQYSRRADEISKEYMQRSGNGGMAERQSIAMSLWTGGMDIFLMPNLRIAHVVGAPWPNEVTVPSGGELIRVVTSGFSREEIEFMLARNIAMCLIGDFRGERGDAYFKARKVQGEGMRRAADLVHEVASYVVVGGLVEAHPRWIPSYLRSKMGYLWSHEWRARHYQGLCALAEAEGIEAAVSGIATFNELERKGSRAKLQVSYYESEADIIREWRS